jgi:L-asparaginase
MIEMAHQSLRSSKKPSGPYQPTLIIHGGAGAISRSNLPPELYQQYQKSLLEYLKATKALLEEGSSALDAACHAVSLMEDDPLFNCGRGSVFTEAGTIEMEASVMVTSVDEEGPSEGLIKRAAAVSLVRHTRHPILLAKEVLLDADEDGGLGGTRTMHCHLSGENVERWGWKERGLERKEDSWFWTERRWKEHRRGLENQKRNEVSDEKKGTACEDICEDLLPDDVVSGNVELPSQGTVGAVCMDSWGNLAVATSTGGLTNKASGRIGDTPTVGAGFWAESWEEQRNRDSLPDDSFSLRLRSLWQDALSEVMARCLTFPSTLARSYSRIPDVESRIHSYPDIRSIDPDPNTALPVYKPPKQPCLPHLPPRSSRRAVAMSGTGNGDSFLRTNAVRTTASICRFSSSRISLSKALAAITGPGGELQRSAGDRWRKTGEGQGGIIGIEVSQDSELDGSGRRKGKVVFDFNCGGLWRTYYESDDKTGKMVPRVMVLRHEY